jgi:hypothetical protein
MKVVPELSRRTTGAMVFFGSRRRVSAADPLVVPARDLPLKMPVTASRESFSAVDAGQVVGQHHHAAVIGTITRSRVADLGQIGIAAHGAASLAPKTSTGPRPGSA